VLRKFSLILAVVLATSAVLAQESFPVMTAFRDAILYAGPGDSYPEVRWLPAGVPVEARERNRVGSWLYVSTPDDGISGWVPTGYLNSNPDLRFSAIPVNTQLADGDPANVAQPSVAALYAAPLISPISDAMRAVYRRGRDLGSRPDVVTKVGDSLSADPLYLTVMSQEEVVLGPYDYLYDTLTYFRDSMALANVAAQIGLTSYVVFDPMWANADLCRAGESPLACDYRRKQPSIALIMFGANDVRHIDAESFAENMREIVEFTLDRGIIPVLSTFSYSPDAEYWWLSVAFNQAIIDLAAEYEVPLINLWAAARPLDNYGLDIDLTHMSHSGFSYLKYDTGHESWYGVSLRNLLSLVMLDELRLTLEMDE
jgi:hypothetical protein